MSIPTLSSFTTERHGDVLSINVSGKIDDIATADITEAVRRATRQDDRAVILDMGEQSVISDWGVRTIFLIARELQSQETKLALCALSAQVLDKIRITGFERFVSIHESMAQALDSLQTQPQAPRRRIEERAPRGP